MWTDFLNHKSSFFVGAEGIAKATDAVVVYIDVQRVRRGYYHAEFILMTDQPKSFPNYEITVDYARAPGGDYSASSSVLAVES